MNQKRKSNTLIYVVLGVIVLAFALIYAANRSAESGLRGIEESSRRWGEINRAYYHPEETDDSPDN